MAQKPSIPKGTRDFSQVETARRNYIFDTCREVFRLFGYAPIETPAMENLSTLMGKYGEEGDKLLFRIQNSGEQAAAPPEKGLRYDLTVPFARYVVQHQSEIAFPFKRYQMQPVWRADRPQKGRYREFYQCDVDVIGSRGLVNELELIQIVEAVFGRFGVGVTLKLNNRKILAGIAEVMGYTDRLIDITVALDKIEKVGFNAVQGELADKGISDDAIDKLSDLLASEVPENVPVGAYMSVSTTSSDPLGRLDVLSKKLEGSEIGLLGIEEMRSIFKMKLELGIQLDVALDLSLARGLNYYTGTIFEVKARDWAIGSICGGGRYDDLTGIFGMPGVSGVGISFGADRIYDVMEGLNLFPDEATGGTRAMFVNFGGEEQTASLRALATLRAKGIPAEIYPDPAKMKKQMEWANRRAIPFVVMIGAEEAAQGVAALKDMNSGEQRQVALERLAEIIK